MYWENLFMQTSPKRDSLTCIKTAKTQRMGLKIFSEYRVDRIETARKRTF